MGQESPWTYYAFRVVDLELSVEELDSSGQVASKTMGDVGSVERLGVAYFEVVVPGAGTTCGVTVQSFDWVRGGPEAL
ncbi:MAG: hypothetical protein ACE5JN_01305 [Candidatus Methylomirabilia bacterium]